MKRILSLAMIFICVGLFSLSVSAAEVKNEDSITIQNPIQDDTFLTGQSIEVKSPISGEVFAGGKKVEIMAPTNRSIYAAGNEIIISGGSGYNIFATGNTVTIAGTIEHDVYIAGQFITIDQDTHIKGDVWIAGSRVILKGKIDGKVQVSAREVVSEAEIGGSLNGEMPTLEFTGGKIGSELKYRSNRDAIGLDKVTIAGKTERSPIERTSNRSALLLGLLTSFIVGAAIIFLLPLKLQSVTQSVKAAWFQSFIYGIVTLIITPILFFLLITSVVAWPLAVIWFVVVIMLLYISYIMAHIILGHLLLEKIAPNKSNWWVSLVVGLLLIWLILRIPTVGGILIVLFFFAVTIPTLGGSIVWWKKRLTL